MPRDLGWLAPDKDPIKAVGGRQHVYAARVILPALALALVAITIIWMQVNPETAVKKVSMRDVQNTLDTARFTSVDDQGRPFVIEANKVIQQDPTSMTAILDQPRGDITLGDTDHVAVTAQKGTYDQPAKMLYLNGEVTLNRNTDMTIITDQLDVNLNDKSAVGKAPVRGTTTDGNAIEASGVNVAPGGARLIFTGPAKLTIMPKEDGKTP